VGQNGQLETKTGKGAVFTDGVGLSIVKQNYDTSRRSARRQNEISINKEEFKYVDDLSKEGLQKDVGKCVLIDPGRRDLLYCH
jgi:hypothetical protein